MLGRPGIVILALALVVRVALVLATPDPHFAAHFDPSDYDLHAQSIAAGHGYPDTTPYAAGGGPTALRPPLYPYALGGLYAVVGHSITAARLLSVLLGVLTVALIGLVGMQLAGRRAALWAMAIAAVYPPLVLVNATLISEALSLPLMLGALAAALHHRTDPRRRWALLAGALLGLGVLARPAMGVVALPVALALWGAPWRSWRALAAPVLAGVAAIAVLVPWTVRNYDAFDAFVPVFTQSGYLLAGTYNDTSMGDPVFTASFRPAITVPEFQPLFRDPTIGELEISRRLGERARDYIGDHPSAIPKAMWHNGLRMALLDHANDIGRQSYAAQGIGSGYADLARVAFYLVVLLALASLVLAPRTRRLWWLWGTTALLFVSVIPISSDTRYRLQLEPLLVLLAGVAAAKASSAWTKRSGSSI